jgi:Dolichyl-phosphate-mannose-protein mannosyltransferase
MPMSRLQPKTLPFLLMLMGVGLLLRLPNLRLGLWRDEGSTYFDALPESWSEVIRTTTYSELNPPGFFLLMHQWMQWFGSQELVFKVPALIFGVLLIPAIYWLGRVCYSHQTGLMAAAIATFSPEALYYSQEARPYTLTTLLCCLTVMFYYRAIQRSKVSALLGFVACGTLLLYVQYTGCLLLSGLGLATLYLKWRQQRCPQSNPIRLWPLALAFGCIFLLFLPWLPVFLGHLQVGAPWSPKETWWMRPVIFLNHIGFTLMIPSTGTAFTLAALGVGIKVVQRRRQQGLPFSSLPIATLLLGLTALFCAAMLAVLSYNTKRYMLPFTPLAWVVYASWLVSLLKTILSPSQKLSLQKRPFNQRLLVAVLAFLFVVPNSVTAFSLGIETKSGIRPLCADLLTHPVPHTFYLLSPDYFGPTFGYYFSRAHLLPQTQFYGFARWEHPELFSPIDYANLWTDPTLLQQTQSRIQELARQGYDSVSLVQSMRRISIAGQLPYGRANELLDWLKQTYPLLARKDYQASNEPVILYRFSLAARR